MRVLVNGFRALPATAGAGGAGKFFEALLTGLRTKVDLRVIAGVHNRSAMPDHRGIEYVIVGEETQEAYLAHFDWADVYYDPLNGLGPVLIPPRLPVATGIMDLQHNVFPRFFSEAMYDARNRAYGLAVGRANGVLTISEFERQNIRRVYGIGHVYVVHLSGYASEPVLGRPADLLSKARNLTSQEYLIFPAIPWRHKNHFRLLEAVGLLKQDLPDLRLLLTGAEQHSASTAIHEWKLVAEGLEKQVEIQGYLSDEEYLRKLASARGMVFPSLYEGFGIPVVEAMQMGVPVLTVRETAIPEIAGDAVHYFRDPRNSLKMAEDISEFWNDAGLRADLAARGREQGALYSRERFVEETVSALSDIVSRHNATAIAEVSWKPPQLEELWNEPPLTLIVKVEQQGEAALAAIENARRTMQESLLADVKIAWIVDRSVPGQVLAEAFQPGEEYAIAALNDSDEVSLALRFLGESVVNSTYVIYTRTGNLPDISCHSLTAALRLLDYMKDLGCALLDARNTTWTIVSPAATDSEAADIIESIRPRRLAFFENLIVRCRLLDIGGSLGSLRLLSSFVRNVTYLSGPAR